MPLQLKFLDETVTREHTVEPLYSIISIASSSSGASTSSKQIKPCHLYNIPLSHEFLLFSCLHLIEVKTQLTITAKVFLENKSTETSQTSIKLITNLLSFRDTVYQFFLQSIIKSLLFHNNKAGSCSDSYKQYTKFQNAILLLNFSLWAFFFKDHLIY